VRLKDARRTDQTYLKVVRNGRWRTTVAITSRACKVKLRHGKSDSEEGEPTSSPCRASPTLTVTPAVTVSSTAIAPVTLGAAAVTSVALTWGAVEGQQKAHKIYIVSLTEGMSRWRSQERRFNGGGGATDSVLWQGCQVKPV
jgi:hypothetical protein